MFLSNQVKKIIVVSSLLSLTACGGGSEGTAEVPSAPEPTVTQPAPSSIEKSASTVIEYESGIYIRENKGAHSALIINDDTIYYHSLDRDVTMSYVGKFTDLNDVSSDTKIVEAAGFFQQMSESKLLATLSTTFDFNENNIVTGLRGFAIDAGQHFRQNQNLFIATTGLNQLSALNGQWKDANFTEFTIDDALTLTAIDKNGCEISGVLTENETQLFDVSLNYSHCELAGDYSGVLWAYAYAEQNYISWLAYNEAGKPVAASLDTFLDQFESVLTSGQLKASIYSSNGNIVLAKSDEIYVFNVAAGSAFVFNYQNESKSTNFTATGKGVASDESLLDVQMGITVEADTNSFEMEMDYQTNSGFDRSEYFRNLELISLKQRLPTVAGTWGGLTIAENGDVSGNISGCVASGTAGNYQENIADITITLSDCAYDDELTGVATVIEQSNDDGVLEKVIVLSVFNESDAYVLGINTVVKMSL